jgi:hypothetical protein
MLSCPVLLIQNSLIKHCFVFCNRTANTLVANLPISDLTTFEQLVNRNVNIWRNLLLLWLFIQHVF